MRGYPWIPIVDEVSYTTLQKIKGVELPEGSMGRTVYSIFTYINIDNILVPWNQWVDEYQSFHAVTQIPTKSSPLVQNPWWVH